MKRRGYGTTRLVGAAWTEKGSGRSISGRLLGTLGPHMPNPPPAAHAKELRQQERRPPARYTTSRLGPMVNQSRKGALPVVFNASFAYKALHDCYSTGIAVD